MTDHDDDGVTLVELIISIAVSALFLGLLALMFVNGLRAQAQTTDRDTATGQSVVVTHSLLTSLRNADLFQITSAGRALIAEVVRLKPASAKGSYVRNLTVCSTMGAGIKVDPAEAITLKA